jgi:hypothetical protein
MRPPVESGPLRGEALRVGLPLGYKGYIKDVSGPEGSGTLGETTLVKRKTSTMMNTHYHTSSVVQIAVESPLKDHEWRGSER